MLKNLPTYGRRGRGLRAAHELEARLGMPYGISQDVSCLYIKYINEESSYFVSHKFSVKCLVKLSIPMTSIDFEFRLCKTEHPLKIVYV